MQNFFKGFKNFIIKSFGGLDDSSFVSMGGSSVTGIGGVFSLTPANLLAQNKNWVYACVNRIAISIAGVPLKLKKYNAKGDDVEVFISPVLTVLNKPNRLMTGLDFMYTIVGHMQLTGNAYILKDKEKNPTQLFPLNPGSIRANFNELRTEIINYSYTIGGKVTDFPANEIIHLKKPNLSNPYFGSGVLEHIPEWVDVDNAMLDFNRSFFKNGASPSGILKTNATTLAAMELARQAFELKYAGDKNAHRTSVIGKDSEYVSLSASPKDMEFSEADNRFRDKILSAFGVPKSVLGITEDVNRANAEASYFVFMMFTIDPEMKMLVAYLNEWLLPSFSGTDNMYFCYDSIIPENEQLEIQKNQASLGTGQAWSTINEVRAREGLMPIQNGDFVYGGFATIPIGSPVEQIQNAISTPIEKKKGFKTERIQKSVKKEAVIDDIIDKVNFNKINKGMRRAIDDQVHKEFISRVSKFESIFVKAVKEFDKRIQDEVLNNLENEKSFSNRKKDLFNVDTAQNIFIGLTSPILQELLKTEGQAQMDRLDTTTPFSPLAEKVQVKLAKLLNFTAGSYTDTTQKLLQAQLAEGVSNGESLPELTQRVATVFDLTEQYRAERTARTTVFATANNAAREAYIQSGVVKTVVWHTAEDELVCELCAPYDGKEVDINDSFGDVEDPPLHVNCRCFTNAGEIAVERAQQIIETKEKEVDEEAEFLSKMLDVLENE